MCGRVKVWTKHPQRTTISRYACSNVKRATARGEHGLTGAQREGFLAGKVCAGCGDARVIVDHDHRTLRLRGALCSRCNTALGMVDDRIGVLLNLVKYLIGSQAD